MSFERVLAQITLIISNWYINHICSRNHQTRQCPSTKTNSYTIHREILLKYLQGNHNSMS